MTLPRIRPPFVADERTQLVGWLDMQRAIVAYKCEGLSEEDAHRAVLPGSPLMTMAGIVSHPRWVENAWSEVLFLGRPAAGPQFDQDDDLDTKVDGVPLARSWRSTSGSARSRTRSSRRIPSTRSARTRTTGPRGRPCGGCSSVEETARHAGHMDAVRELLDGRKGHY
ncbi:DUF664 domain-containing protein [Streptomyces sp. NPDC006368]|uniref:mycothiol transferase n=1 Tax=Streptomyces sp. NPDC006368 TaxID=3156760 RepID=UPI0033A3B123